MNVPYIRYGDYEAYWGGGRWNIHVRGFFINLAYLELYTE